MKPGLPAAAPNSHCQGHGGGAARTPTPARLLGGGTLSLEKLQTDGSGAREPWVVGSSRCLFPCGDKVYLFSEGLPRKTIFGLSSVREQPVKADQF